MFESCLNVLTNIMVKSEHGNPDVDIDAPAHDHIDVEDDDAGDVEVDGEDTHYI